MPTLFSSSVSSTWTVPKTLLRRAPVISTPVISYAYDTANFDLAVSGAGRVRYAAPDLAAIQAAAFIVSIQPGRYPLFSRGFGCDLESCLAAGSRAATERAIEAEMKRALQAAQDSRLRNLEAFAFDWSFENLLIVSYTLVLANGIQVKQDRKVATV